MYRAREVGQVYNPTQQVAQSVKVPRYPFVVFDARVCYHSLHDPPAFLKRHLRKGLKALRRGQVSVLKQSSVFPAVLLASREVFPEPRRVEYAAEGPVILGNTRVCL